MTVEPDPRFEGQNVVITGAGGFLGSQLGRSLSLSAGQLVRVARNPLPPMPDAATDVDDIQGDIRDPNLWQRVFDRQVDVVFHLAGQTDLRHSLADPMEDLDINTMATLRLLEGARRSGQCPAVVFASTATTAGVSHTTPVDESGRERPLSIYDANKLQSENYLRIFATEGYISGASLRLTNVFGAGHTRTGTNRGILDRVLDRALKGETVRIFEPGNWLRDYVFVDDVIAAFQAAGSESSNLKGDSYLVGSGVGTPLADAFQLVSNIAQEATGVEVPIMFVEPPEPLHPVEERNFIANTDALHRDTGWSCKWSLEDGLRETLRRRKEQGNIGLES
ncbi:MAG: NAD-dependent epimerase/dehydratase family protein [Alphaproteobacteria bacterium]